MSIEPSRDPDDGGATNRQPDHHAVAEPPIRAIRPWWVGVTGLVLAMGAVLLVVRGISARAHTENALSIWTNAQAVPTVALVEPTVDEQARQITLPGTIQAFYAAPIYPRVTGYVKSWSTDIGAHVSKGQVLATIDTPDLDQQLIQAQANLASAVAGEQLAAVTANRWSQLLKSQTVSVQDQNEKISDAIAKQAAVQAAQANVGQLEAFQRYKNIVAPFDGIVTARHVDIGDLVSAGSAGSALFQVSDVHKVRIYVQVPQAFAGKMQPGLNATLNLPQYPDEIFDAKLATTANAFDEASRTVQVELQADNANDKLWPGTFAEVSFSVPAAAHVLHVPATALVLDANGVRVALLGSGDKVKFQTVTLGRDLGDQAEVLSGLSLADKLIDSPPEWLSAGDTVKVASQAR
ncbi:efflux RND transporter periplasmic adaptor subunit [Acidisoma cellulosilytica]|uniref:Efflux RND transporter periplasmic adaptor subunit n=1 Tax=Acidisoma cellulosilyticum TaxID=2802395 RepID=A0A963Z3P9_9PROT|nr:efflux RND transporter periplasmic adaptor subunit [Acidisoma cellulosilyticum]MCB8881465.1 efflux RND transporter periplasmic adaptor subunit [Acidisoma cellulosilyticum]